MRCLKNSLRRTDDKKADDDARLYPIADLHIGDPTCKMSIAKKLVDTVLHDAHGYAILCGDLINNATKSSVSDAYGETISPDAQLQDAVKLFKPLADAKKIIAIVPGNHELRTYREDGISLTHVLAVQLGCEDVYSDTTAILILQVGWCTQSQRPFKYSVYVTHGSGGGRRPGSKINRLDDYGKIIDADVYICGHTHMPASFRQSFYRCHAETGTVKEVDRLYVNTASCLGYDGGYGDRAGMTPGSNSYPIITLRGKGVHLTDAMATVTL